MDFTPIFIDGSGDIKEEAGNQFLNPQVAKFFRQSRGVCEIDKHDGADLALRMMIFADQKIK